MKCPYVFKICTKCGKLLFINKFKKGKGCKHGRRGICKECAKQYDYSKKKRQEYNKTYNLNNQNKKEYNRKYNKTYKRKTYDHICECCEKEFTSRRKDTRFCSQKCVASILKKDKKYNDSDCRDRNGVEYINWRKAVFERDNYTCQHCGEHGGKLNAHHLNSWNWDIDNRLNTNNGITLCEKCHKKFHNQYGNRNNTKEQFDKFND